MEWSQNDLVFPCLFILFLFLFVLFLFIKIVIGLQCFNLYVVIRLDKKTLKGEGTTLKYLMRFVGFWSKINKMFEIGCQPLLVKEMVQMHENRPTIYIYRGIFSPLSVLMIRILINKCPLAYRPNKKIDIGKTKINK